MSKKSRTHRRKLLDPSALDRRSGPYQVWKVATEHGFEVVVTETPTLHVVTVGGVHESRGTFNAHWREGAVSSAEHSNQGLGVVSVTKLKAWLRGVESPARPRDPQEDEKREARDG